MGRKKIEIRPLTDERNRNVTFLKRKAGLMKKAWELSVLCGADVSIMIFSAAGKAFEFSSRDLDGEIDRYLEYEGLIERRRAEEFAAMAEAGEDDDDDDEDDTAAKRKGSMSKGGKGAATPSDDKKPVKSLKGKEVYKVKMPSRREIITAAEPKRKKRDKSQQGFIEGLVSDSDGDRDERDRSRESSDLANMNYAMSLGPSNAAAQTLASFPSSLPPQPYSQPLTSHYRSTPHGLQGSPPVKPELGYSPAAYGQTHGLPSHSQPIHYPPNMGGIQWDASLLQRYTEFQMQQNHQRQHRLLLQRQREQLALLGVGIGQEGERRLLDDIFGAGGASGSRASGSGGDGNYQANGQGSQQGEDAGFLWPTFGTPHQQSQTPYNHHPQQPSHQDQGNSRDSGSLPPDSNRQYNYPEDFDYERHRQAQSQSQSQSQSIPTPSSISTAAATPWYSNLRDMGGEASRAGDEVPYGATADFGDFIGRKRAGEDLAAASGGSDVQGSDKRVRVA